MKIKRILKNKNFTFISMITILLIICISCAIYLVYRNQNNKQEKETYIEPINELDEIIVPIEEDGEEISIEELGEEENKIDGEITEKPKTPTTTSNNSGPTYYIKVNILSQVVNIYKKDDNGNYTIPVKAFVCSTGSATPTSGIYSIPARWEWLRLEGYVWGHYSTQIKGNILFHSVPYLEKGNLASLEYWEYDKLGTAASAGCVRLKVQDAQWIYNNCEKGTKVEFYSDSNPGPFGKPSAKKISSYPEYLRNWDPTDPNPNNPWKNYKEETTNNNNSNENKNDTTVNNKTNNTVDNTSSNIINEQENNIKVNNIIEDNKTNIINEDNTSNNKSNTENLNPNTPTNVTITSNEII